MTTSFDYVLTVGPSGASPAASASGNVVEITDVTAQGLARLIPEYQSTTRFQDWIASVLDTVQEMETAAADLWELVINLDSAVGDQLDLIGRIVQEGRESRTDADYRTALSVRVLVNRSQGRHAELVLISRTYTDADSEATAYVRVRDVQPATVEVRVVRTPVTTRGELDKRLRQAKAAGVALSTIIHPGGPAGSFVLIDGAGSYPEGNTTTGLSDGALGSVAGGELADVLG